MMPAASGSASRPGRIPSLGNTAKSLRAGRGDSSKINKLGTGKRIKYALQQEASRLLFDGSAGKRQKFRVCHCGRSIRGEGVSIKTAPGEARFGGLVTCGSGWTCPVCSGVIGERRRAELSAALVQHATAGGLVYLFTFTMPHQAADRLADGLKMLDKARQTFKNRAGYKNLKLEAGLIGTVTALEVTHGRNGWHPHCHALLFVSRALSEWEKDALRSTWASALIKAGADSSKLSDILAHGLDIRGGEDAAAYVTKYGREESWGITSEVTRAHVKDARGEGQKPFGLLELSARGDTRAAGLFTEYAEAFLGKRLLTWSPGLKARFNLEEIEDEALAEQESAEFVARAWVTPEQWRVVLSRHARADLLDFAARYLENVDDPQAEVDAYIDSLTRMPPQSRGWYWQPMERRFN